MSMEVSTSDLYNKDNALHNIILSEKLNNYQMIDASIIGWCKSNPESTLMDLEVELRNNDSNLYLFATSNINENYMYVVPNNFDITVEYNLEYKILDENEYEEELENRDVTQEENLLLLESTGLEFDKDINLDNLHDLLDDLDSDDMIELLFHVAIKL